MFVFIYKVGWFAEEIFPAAEREPAQIKRRKPAAGDGSIRALINEQWSDEDAGCLRLMFMLLADLVYCAAKLAFLTFYHYLFPISIVFSVYHQAYNTN